MQQGESTKCYISTGRSLARGSNSYRKFSACTRFKNKAWGGKSWPTASKDGLGVNDAESASEHEDDALFGDLFSEASRQVVISDGHGQPCVFNPRF